MKTFTVRICGKIPLKTFQINFFRRKKEIQMNLKSRFHALIKIGLFILNMEDILYELWTKEIKDSYNIQKLNLSQ